MPPENEHLIAWNASVNEGLENIRVHPASTCSTACLHRDHNVGNKTWFKGYIDVFNTPKGTENPLLGKEKAAFSLHRICRMKK